MHRSAVVKVIRAIGALTAAVGLASACTSRGPVVTSPPNLVLIVIDTLRPDRLPLYGGAAETAPFLASVAARSVVFERAYSTSSWTSPATVSLLTSLLPFQHGVHVATFVPERAAFAVRTIPDAAETLAERLARAGYRTFAVVDNKNVMAAAGFARGFERFENTDYQSATGVQRVLAAWQKTVQAAKPYFLYVHFMDPHMPYHDRDPWYADFKAASIEPDPERRDVLARYDSEIRYLDEHLREVWNAWGWDRDAIVVITSDHGEEFGEHGGEQHGRTLFGEVLDVPLLLHHPGRWTDGRRVATPASLVDVAPTLLDLAGLPPSDAHVGRSLVPEIDRPARRSHAAFAQLIHPGPKLGSPVGAYEIRGVVANDRKLLDYDDRPDELFDLRADPGETRNVIDDVGADADAMRARLTAAAARTPRYEPGRSEIPLTDKEIEKLRALGYLK